MIGVLSKNIDSHIRYCSDVHSVYTSIHMNISCVYSKSSFLETLDSAKVLRVAAMNSV